MDESQRRAVFDAQGANVRSLDTARRLLIKHVNHSLRRGDTVSASLQTKLLAVLYSVWSEATLTKLIHTPFGFSLNEIAQIKRDTNGKSRSIEGKWTKCVELALQRVEGVRSGEVANRRKRLLELVDQYIVDRSILRNKLAHGQWIRALNSDNDAVNLDLTTEIADLSVVAITTYFMVHENIAHIVEDMIESPDRAFNRDYWIHLTALEEVLHRRSGFTLDEHVARLKRKPIILPP